MGVASVWCIVASDDSSLLTVGVASCLVGVAFIGFIGETALMVGVVAL